MVYSLQRLLNELPTECQNNRKDDGMDSSLNMVGRTRGKRDQHARGQEIEECGNKC